MSQEPILPFVAVDVGNTRIKLGLFTSVGQSPLPHPASTLDVDPRHDDLAKIRSWLGALDVAHASWWIGSVQRETAGRLVAWLSEHGARRITMLASGDLPLVVNVPLPDRVGIDRLLDAVATNRLRAAGEAAIVVDLGTAITVDLISTDGAFLGGAIMPGIATSARAMHEFTDLLPLVEMSRLGEPPAPLGTATVAAMQAGLYWGAVGGVRELVARLGAKFDPRPRLFLSGGAAPSVAGLLAENAQYIPHLTLAGIALTATQ